MLVNVEMSVTSGLSRRCMNAHPTFCSSASKFKSGSSNLGSACVTQGHPIAMGRYEKNETFG